MTSDEVTSTAAGPWGPDVLARLDQDQDWRQIETIWRLGPAEHIERTSVLMANSNDERLGTLLVEEVLLHRYQTATDKIPGLLYENHTPCDPAIADRLLERVLSEDPLPGPHADKKPVLLAWLLSQPGTALDDLAVAIATENHAYATSPEARDAAILRIAHDAGLQDRLVSEFTACPERWASVDGWNRTVDAISRATTKAKGLAPLVRDLATALGYLTGPGTITNPAAFQALILRHATPTITELFRGKPLDPLGGGELVLLIPQVADRTKRVEMITALATHQPELWTAHRTQLHSGIDGNDAHPAWDDEDWAAVLKKWSGPVGKIHDLAEVLEAAPATHSAAVIRVVVAQEGTPGDPSAAIAASALRHLTDAEDQPPAAATINEALCWDIVLDAAKIEYLAWIIQSGTEPGMYLDVVVHAYETGLLPTGPAIKLTNGDRLAGTLDRLAPGPKRAEYVNEALHDDEDGAVQTAINLLLSATEKPFDLIEALAPSNPNLAFGAIDDERWHDLNNQDKDGLLTLLDQYATPDQRPLLTTIAADTDGANTRRRATAARRWAGLASRHEQIPDEIFTLLDSSRTELVEAFADIMETVQPFDQETLQRLRAKWADGGPSGRHAQRALEAVAEGLLADLSALKPQDRAARGPILLNLLGITSSPAAFEPLLTYVGAECIDDNVDLRIAAAAALQEFVRMTTITADQILSLGQRTEGSKADPDPKVGTALREALALAKMGDDVALKALYDLVGLNPAQITRPADEMFGQEKPALLHSLTAMTAQQALGRVGWGAYVEQMDLVAVSLVRSAYLHHGQTEHLKESILTRRPGTPDHASLLGNLGTTKGFKDATDHLKTLHNIRSTKTNAHPVDHGGLTDDLVAQARSALCEGGRIIVTRLLEHPHLRAVPKGPEAEKGAG